MANTGPLLGIIAALPAEARTAGVGEVPAGQAVDVAEHVLSIRCGIGRARAERAARDLVGAGAVALLSWGTAAAVSRDLDHGDLVLPLEVLSRDGNRFSVDHQWRHRLAEILAAERVVRARAVREARYITIAALTSLSSTLRPIHVCSAI